MNQTFNFAIIFDGGTEPSSHDISALFESKDEMQQTFSAVFATDGNFYMAEIDPVSVKISNIQRSR